MIEKLRKRIEAYLGQPGTNRVALASQAGVHRNTLRDFKSEFWRPTQRTVRRLSEALDRMGVK